jgi:hypothetical protein
MNVSLIDGSNLSAVDEFSRRAAVGNPWRAAQREGHERTQESGTRPTYSLNWRENYKLGPLGGLQNQVERSIRHRDVGGCSSNNALRLGPSVTH